MSTSRLMHVTITASMTTAPSTQGVSSLLMDSTMNRPIPGQAKIVSVVTAPPRAEGVCDKCGGALEQRKDDLPETVQHRLEVYHSETEPLKGFYEAKGVLKKVPDLGGIDETNAEIMALLGK